jgi:hypothetical protein
VAGSEPPPHPRPGPPPSGVICRSIWKLGPASATGSGRPGPGPVTQAYWQPPGPSPRSPRTRRHTPRSGENQPEATGRFPYGTHKEAAEASLRELRVAAFVNGHWLREAKQNLKAPVKLKSHWQAGDFGVNPKAQEERSTKSTPSRTAH